MAAELPPPAYDEVVSTAPPPRYSSFSRQDSLPEEAKRRLLQDVTRLKEKTFALLPEMRRLTDDVDTSYMKVKVQRSRLERELSDWKSTLISLIEETFNEKMEDLTSRHETAEHKLMLNREKVLQIFDSSRQLCWQSADLASSRNHHTMVILKRRFKDKLLEIDALKASDLLPDSSTLGLQFVKPQISHEDVRDLVGKIRSVTPPQSNPAERPSQSEQRPVNQTDVTRPSEAENNERNVNLSQPTPPGQQDSVDGGQVQSNATTGANAEPPPAAPVESETPSEPPTYKLVHTIQTKTFKDKARCHPYSFAVDFDGNIIVADKFNKKLKIFTQRGQLIREIVHPSLLAPQHATLTLAGDIAVSDSEAADVKFFSTQGTLLGNVPRLTNAGGIAFNLMGDLLVTDTGQKAVHFVDAQVGKIKSTVQYYKAEVEVPVHPAVYRNSRQSGVRLQEQRFKYFQWPHYITTGNNDEIMVTDRAACDYKVFNASGHYIQTVGKPGWEFGEFSDPYGICTYMGESVLVADYGNHQIQTIDLQGNFKEPLLNDTHGLHFPTYVTYTTDGKVMVSEYLSGKVKIFSSKTESQEEDEPLPPSYSDVVGVSAAQPVEGSASGASGERFAVGPDMYYYEGQAYSHNLVVDPHFYDDLQNVRPVLRSQPSWETSI